MSRKKGKQSRTSVTAESANTVKPNPQPSYSTVLADTAGTEKRQRMIAEAAYFRAERRGFVPGNELEDWLQAEADVERALQTGASRSRPALT